MEIREKRWREGGYSRQRHSRMKTQGVAGELPACMAGAQEVGDGNGEVHVPKFCP